MFFLAFGCAKFNTIPQKTEKELNFSSFESIDIDNSGLISKDEMIKFHETNSDKERDYENPNYAIGIIVLAIGIIAALPFGVGFIKKLFNDIKLKK
jgi:hypothetical protein